MVRKWTTRATNLVYYMHHVDLLGGPFFTNDDSTRDEFNPSKVRIVGHRMLNQFVL